MTCLDCNRLTHPCPQHWTPETSDEMDEALDSLRAKVAQFREEAEKYLAAFEGCTKDLSTVTDRCLLAESERDRWHKAFAEERLKHNATAERAAQAERERDEQDIELAARFDRIEDLQERLETVERERDDMRAMLDRIAEHPDVADAFDPRSEECVADGVEGAIEAIHCELSESRARVEALEGLVQRAADLLDRQRSFLHCACGPAVSPCTYCQARQVAYDVRSVLGSTEQKEGKP